MHRRLETPMLIPLSNSYAKIALADACMERFPALSSLYSPICSAFTMSQHADVSLFPPEVSQICSGDPVKVSSVCACLMALTSTTGLQPLFPITSLSSTSVSNSLTGITQQETSSSLLSLPQQDSLSLRSSVQSLSKSESFPSGSAKAQSSSSQSSQGDILQSFLGSISFESSLTPLGSSESSPAGTLQSFLGPNSSPSAKPSSAHATSGTP